MDLRKAASQHSVDDAHVAAVRRFNRFYTRQIGVLRKNFLDSPYSLAEARVLYEIAQRQRRDHRERHRPRARPRCRLSEPRAAQFRKARLDPTRGFATRRAAKPSGRFRRAASKAYAPLERRSQRDIGAMLGRLRPRIGAADRGDEHDRNAARRRSRRRHLNARYRLRAPVPGDFGWIVKRHAELYAQEYGWIEPFEGVCAQIVADFANKYDAKRERCWIAEMDGENVGCVFLVAHSDTTARIRLLLVDPKARGLKLGARLVDECVGFARRAGYKKITLWTHSVLTAARHIYQKAGFKLTRSEKRVSCGQPVVSEHWDLEL